MDPSFEFCCQCPALTGIKEGGLHERLHQLNLRSKRDVLVPPYDEALPGVIGNMGISGEQENKGLKMRGTGEQRQLWGSRNIENQDFDFGEQGNEAILFRGTRGQVSSMIFSLEKAAVVWAILERISGFYPSLEMIDPMYLKFSTASSL